MFNIFKKTRKKQSYSQKKWKSHIRFSVRHPLLIGHYTVIGGGERKEKLRSIDDVARFICEKGIENGNLTITTADNSPFISTFGIYLNKIEDKAYREKLLDVLAPMQAQVDNDALSAAIAGQPIR